MLILAIFSQSLNPSRGRLSSFHDSTEGTGIGFAFFVLGFFIFLILGTWKAFRDEKKWNGRVMNRPQKPRERVYKFD